MKKLFLIALMVSALVSSVFAGTYNIPSGFSLKESSYGAKLYVDSSINMYAIVLDVDKGDVDFGLTDHAYSNLFNKSKIKDWWNKYSNYSNFAMVNGQFFDHNRNPTPISFSLKADGNIIVDYLDNSLPKKTLLRTIDGNFYIKDGYDQSYLSSSSISDVLVGLFHTVNVGDKQWYPIGRNYIGGIPRNSCNSDYATCQYKYLLFIIKIYEYI